MKRVLFFLAICIANLSVYAQLSLSGTLRYPDGQTITGANVVLQHTHAGTVSNTSGYYQINNLKAGVHIVQVSYVGYKTISDTLSLNADMQKDYTLQPADVLADEIIVSSTRAQSTTPVAYTNLDKADIAQQNNGKDLPFMLALTPSLVTSSDGGTGVGYTSLSIRGSDITRINVTINGIPANDAESHGVWWVNMPDLASSLDNIQIQRGVGTSTHGAAAFGATINLQTYSLHHKAYAQVNQTYGSFNTYRSSVSVGSGLLSNHFTVDARLSQVHSDGFVDRAFSDLSSYFISAGYYGKKTILRLNTFSGSERTYQAWWGVPKVRLENDMEGMLRYSAHGLYTEEQTQEMINANPRTYNYYTYKNETDNYKQTHYQAILSTQLPANWMLNLALHYTQGAGYYEQFRPQDAFSNYQNVDYPQYSIEDIQIGGATVVGSDLVRRKWLDNQFYGATYALQYNTHVLNLTAGGGWNQYDGLHYGEITWAQYASNTTPGFRWYENEGTKTDLNNYLKADYSPINNLHLFADIQYRKIGYQITGIHDDYHDLSQTEQYDFVNPKAGVFYRISSQQEGYASFAVANREPSRSEFRDADAGELPVPENLKDIEAGYKISSSNFEFQANLFWMMYKNQLVLTGEINDVGSAIKTNVPESFRRGIELIGGVNLPLNLTWNANLTLSENKIKNLTSLVDNWDYWNDPANEPYQITEEQAISDLAFSPSVIASSLLEYSHKGFSTHLATKYVSKQYIDNTSDNSRSLHPYWVNDWSLAYEFGNQWIQNIRTGFTVHNLLNAEYETFAWVYRYVYGGQQYTMDGYFPQAGRHFSATLSLSF